MRRPRAARRLAGTRVCLAWKQRLLEPATGWGEEAPARSRRGRGGHARPWADQEPGPLPGERNAAGRAGRAGRGERECEPGRGGGEELVFHEGVTRGFVAFAGFNPQAGTGLVALVSSPPPRRRRFLQSAYETLRGLSAEQQRR